MPGLIGAVGARATPAMITSAAAAISHFDEYCNQRCSPLNSVEIAQVWRNSSEGAGSWYHDSASRTSVFVNGTVIAGGAHSRVIDAQEVAGAYLGDRLAPETYDGAFVIVIADDRSHELIVYNDRLGTLPCYYYADERFFCFAPEAKAIFSALGTAPEYSADGFITFLVLGYCLADTTLFNAIRCLTPGSRVVIKVPTLKYDIGRYWSMQHDPVPGLRSRRKAEEALHESIIAGHRAALLRGEQRYDMLLSGGWDSRGMLAAAHDIGHMPRRSVSWGLRDDVPGSDPFLAAQLAEQYGVEHRFLSYDTDAFVETAAQWSYLTELNTDNFGWYGEGTSILLKEYTGDAEFVLAGDECWGFGGYVRNRVEGLAANQMPAPFPGPLAECLTPRLKAACADRYSAQIEKVLEDCASMDPTDRKDFLYVHGRLARFIFSLGYYKELAVQVRRPFLSTEVLDVMQKIPTRFRYGKNLYISTLLRFFPELLRVDRCSAVSLPQWRRDLGGKPALSAYFAGLLSRETLAQRAFAEWLDLDQIEKITTAFFAAPRHEEPARRAHRTARQGVFVESVKQRAGAYDDVRLALHLRKPAKRRFDNFDLLRRIALLSVLDQNWSRFAPVR